MLVGKDFCFFLSLSDRLIAIAVNVGVDHTHQVGDVFFCDG